ncbi:MAG TPA: Stf0 family sulfotransferase [Gaiellaceae bacterium]|nr:Stf0 family sulfotransferase [Gaiellaceae bacterium]
MRVERSLLICFVARSGSWFLCGLLASTGVLGRPEEFFWMPGDRVASQDLGHVLRRGSTSNRVFSCKFQLGQWSELLARARRGATDLPDRELVGRMFPNPLYIWLQREDTVAQAVSWSRAMQTGLWSTRNEGSGEPRYDRSEIAGLLELSGWERRAGAPGSKARRSSRSSSRTSASWTTRRQRSSGSPPPPASGFRQESPCVPTPAGDARRTRSTRSGSASPGRAPQFVIAISEP